MKEDQKMKKILSVFLVLTCLLGMSACSSDEEPSTEGGEVKQEEQKSEYALNETAEIEGVKYTLTAVERNSGFSYNTPESGKEYVIVTVSIENGSEDKVDYNPYNFKMLNSQGQEIDNAFVVDLDNQLDSGELTPGGSITGRMCFEEPAGDTGLKLNYYDNIFNEEPSCSFVLGA